MRKKILSAGRAIGWTFMDEGYTGSPKNTFWMTDRGKTVLEWSPDTSIGDCLPLLAALDDDKMSLLCLSIGVYPACRKEEFVKALLDKGAEAVFSKACSLLGVEDA